MNIASLSYFTPLVKDYLTRFEQTPIHDFFAIAPDAPHEHMREIIDARLARERSLAPMHRKTVADSIRAFHASLGPVSSSVVRNLDLLKFPDTLAIVTGQQTGVLGGPLYTFYKAFTAIQLAKSFRERFPGLVFIPIFWIETEDHDLEEIISSNVLNVEGSVESTRYIPSLLSEHPDLPWRKQAGPTLLEETPIADFFEKLQGALQPTAFSAEIFDMLRGSYAPRKTFTQAFASLLLHYFGEDGLLLIDANARELKSLTKNLFRHEIETSPQLSEKIILQSVKLEETYHAQVKPRALNLFYINEEGERLPIVEKEKDAGNGREFFLKPTRQDFTLRELLTTLDEHPERFSPNVVMRPLYQDSLLPTVTYVAGPGEMAYYAQFAPAYAWAGVPMPLIHPRVTVTLIEERLERIFTKFHITPDQILSDGHGRDTALFDLMIESDLAPRFEHALEEIDRSLESLRQKVSQAEPTLDGALTSLKGKVLTAIRDFQGKTLAAERKRHVTTKAQLDKLLSSLLPSEQLQERELSLVYFLNKYGPTFFEMLKRLLEPVISDFREHHIIHLNQIDALPLDGADSEAGRTSATSEPLRAFPN